MSAWDWVTMSIIGALGSMCYPVRRKYKFFGRLRWRDPNQSDKRGIERPDVTAFHNDEVAVYALPGWASVMSKV